MDNLPKLALPFLTRDMLAFKVGAVFELVVTYRANLGSDIVIRGATKEAPFSFQFIPVADSSQNTLRFALSDLPIWVSAIDLYASFGESIAFVTVGLAVNGDTLYNLCSGFITSLNGVSWPHANLGFSTPTAVMPEIITGSDPAAGAEISVAVSTGQIWEVYGLRFALVTDANAATRTVHVVMKIAGVSMFDFIANTNQTASLTRNYSCMQTTPGGSLADGTDIVIPLGPGLILNGNGSIITKTANLQATDNYGAPSVYIRRWFRSI